MGEDEKSLKSSRAHAEDGSNGFAAVRPGVAAMGEVSRAVAMLDPKPSVAVGARVCLPDRESGQRHSPARLAGGLLLATVVVASLSACGSKNRHADGRAVTTTGAVVATSSTLPPSATEVAAAWRRFWDVYVAASNPMNPADPRLKEVATGDELKTLTSAFLASKTAGEVYKGNIDLAPTDVNVAGDTATLRDCYLSHILAYDAATGTLRDQASNVRRLVRANLVKEGGVWKVSSINHEGDGCSPGA